MSAHQRNFRQLNVTSNLAPEPMPNSVFGMLAALHNFKKFEKPSDGGCSVVKYEPPNVRYRNSGHFLELEAAHAPSMSM